MTIILGIFIGLMGVLLFAFFNFDILVKIEYRKYRDEWAIAAILGENKSDGRSRF